MNQFENFEAILAKKYQAAIFAISFWQNFFGSNLRNSFRATFKLLILNSKKVFVVRRNFENVKLISYLLNSFCPLNIQESTRTETIQI